MAGSGDRAELSGAVSIRVFRAVLTQQRRCLAQPWLPWEGEVLWGGASFLEEQLEPLLSGAVTILHKTKGGTQGKF